MITPPNQTVKTPVPILYRDQRGIRLLASLRIEKL
jgi:hypothetical protein